MTAAPPSTTVRRCGNCASFRNDPDSIERAFPGLRSMGSGFASVCAYDGLCDRWNRYLSANDGCDQFRPAGDRIRPDQDRPGKILN